MAYYYVDYENVHSNGLLGIDLLSKGDKVFIFTGSSTDTIRFDALQQVISSPATVEILVVPVGNKDALDFQLVTHLFLGYKPNRKYFIIAKDNGYDYSIKMAKSRGCTNIKRYLSIAQCHSLRNNGVCGIVEEQE